MIFHESSHLELKEQINADFKKEIIAFANTDGGLILLGVNETLLGKLPSKVPTKLPSNLEVTFRAICEARLLGDSKMSLSEYIIHIA